MAFYEVRYFYQHSSFLVFDENAVGKALLKENVRNIFANSFLVEASKEAFESEVIYAKLNVERKPEFQIGTSIVEKNGQKSVVKYAIHVSAQQHIDKVCDTTRFDGKKVKYLPAKKCDEGIDFEFLYENNLDTQIVEYIDNKDGARIIETLDAFFAAYLSEFSEIEITSDFYTDTFKMYFGDEKTDIAYRCVNDANIDVILDNIYEIDKKYVLIDGEWIYPEWIPYEFIQWRVVNELYTKHSQLPALILRNEMLEHYGISEADEKLFHAWAVYFANTYVGSAYRGRWAKIIQNISLDQIHQEVRAGKVTNMSLYLDCGNGFSEEGKLYQDVNIENNEFEVTFTSEQLKNAKALRFDPIEGQVCVLNITSLSKGFVESGDNSCEQLESGKLFVNLDPQVYINVEEEMDSLTIKAAFKVIQKTALVKCLQEINDKRLMLGAHVVNVENRVRELFEELGQTSNELNRTSEELNQTSEELNRTSEELNRTSEELNQTSKELEVCKDTIFAQHNLRECLSSEWERKLLEKDRIIANLMCEKDYYAAENEKHAYIANSTKAFVKRKIKIKINSFLSKIKK